MKALKNTASHVFNSYTFIQGFYRHQNIQDIVLIIITNGMAAVFKGPLQPRIATTLVQFSLEFDLISIRFHDTQNLGNFGRSILQKDRWLPMEIFEH